MLSQHDAIRSSPCTEGNSMARTSKEGWVPEMPVVLGLCGKVLVAGGL